MTGATCRRVLPCKSRARPSAGVAAFVGALLLATGCSTQGGVGGFFDRAFGRTPAEGQPRVSYAAEARIKVYSEPDASSSVMGVLDRYEEIARYQSVSGFAYVEAKGNLSGWVPESQLVERRPQARKPAAVEPAPPEEIEPAQPAEGTAEPGDSTESEAGPPPGPDAPTEVAPPEPGAEPLEPERSVFDPY